MKPKILVTRKLSDGAEEKLKKNFDVTLNLKDEPIPNNDLVKMANEYDGFISTGFDKIGEDFFKDLNLLPSDQKFLIFSKTDSTNYNKWDDVFESKDFGWKGKIKNNDLQNFINYKFDVLISFYTVNEIELNQVTAMSQANFKVGISNDDERLYDLIIDIMPSDFKNFKTEFKKYITILNKL